MRVFLEVKECNGTIHYVNLDRIEEIIVDEKGKYKIWFNENNYVSLSEDEYKRWRKFVEII